jgi:hypothetical protein
VDILNHDSGAGLTKSEITIYKKEVPVSVRGYPNTDANTCLNADSLISSRYVQPE